VADTESTIPVDQLRAAGLGDDVEAVAGAVARYLDDGTTTNVAVVSEPFAGREALLDYAEGLLDDATRIRLSEAVTDDPPAVPEAGALLVDDCHYLYRRCIDGFDPLERFLERIAASDTFVVTAWNRYSWSYLAGAREVGDSFPVVVELPRLDHDQLRRVIRERFGPALPAFVETDAAGRIKTVAVDRRQVRLVGDLRVDVPVPALNGEYLATLLADEGRVERVVFEKLQRLSHGNPGIATSLWRAAVRERDGRATIAPADLDDPVAEFAIRDDDRAAVLWAVVANETVSRETLNAVTYDISVDKELQLLAQRGVVTVDGDAVAITPGGLHPAVDALERRRFLW